MPIIPILFTTACSTTPIPMEPKQLAPVIAVPEVPKALLVEKPKRARNSEYHAQPSVFGNRLSSAAKERTRHNIVYDGRYIQIGYPWGDVPRNIGVCTDVVIRSYRRLGIDLQQQVHKDMQNNFNAYPNLSKWELDSPDTNIDHRRVYNLKAFFARHGKRLPRSNNPRHYVPGDLVTWRLGPGQEHIGIVVNQRSKQDPERHLIVHNIAQGPKMEDILFQFPMSGHYRYSGNMRYYRPTPHLKPVSVKGLGFIPPELR